MARLLIIEDEAELLHALEQLFVHDGHDVLTAADGEQGLCRFREGRVDLVIVDILLPKLDGFAVCKAIRHGSDVPIIVTTALDDEGHQLQGFSLLADDYVTKPYSLSVMRERVRAVLRRCATRSDAAASHAIEPTTAGGPAGGAPIAASAAECGTGTAARGLLGFGDIIVDTEAREVLLRGDVVTLTRTEFDILTTLASNPARVFSREDLIDRIWKDAPFVTERTVDVHITRLRKKLGAKASLISSRPGYGYRFNYTEE